MSMQKLLDSNPTRKRMINSLWYSSPAVKRRTMKLKRDELLLIIRDLARQQREPIRVVQVMADGTLKDIPSRSGQGAKPFDEVCVSQANLRLHRYQRDKALAITTVVPFFVPP